MLLQESACNSRIYFHQISALKKNPNKKHSTVTGFHSKLQQATMAQHQPSASCSRSLLPKGRSWNKHWIVSQWLARLQMLQSYLLLHGTDCSTFRKKKKNQTTFILQLPEGHQNMWCAHLPHTLDLLYLQERWRVNCLWKLLKPTYIFSIWKYGQNLHSL